MTGETIDSESLGGATVHGRTVGVQDLHAADGFGGCSLLTLQDQWHVGSAFGKLQRHPDDGFNLLLHAVAGFIVHGAVTWATGGVKLLYDNLLGGLTLSCNPCETVLKQAAN